MLGANITTINSTATPTVDDVINWLRQKSERGEISHNSSRIRTTSLSQLSSILANDEPKSADYLLSNIESIAKRWATLNGAAKGGTARTYESRTKTSIEEYFRWLADPVGFQFSRRDDKDEESPRLRAKQKAKQITRQQAVAHQAEQAQTLQSGTVQPTTRNFPLGSDNAFDFKLPQQGISVDDWRKIACHLLTLATDFNPATPSHAQTWSIVARGE